MAFPDESSVYHKEFSKYILWFVYSCVIYAIIGFSWGAIMGGMPSFRLFVNNSAHGHLIVLAHAHINLLGWVEMAIFAALYYVVPRIARAPIYSMQLVKIHFWTHTIGLVGMVIMLVVAGILGGAATEEAEKQVSHLMAFVGIFGMLVLIANIIWGYNLFRTSAGWKQRL